MRTVVRLAAVAAVSVIMLAVVPGTAPATAPSATIQILSQGQLEPMPPTGNIALVTIYYSCGPAFHEAGTVQVAVTQPTGSAGTAPQPALCDDRKHKLTAKVGPGPFEAGSASAIVFLSNAGISTSTSQAEITLK
jgi:hypothetical protein